MRRAVSDIALKRDLPADLGGDLMTYVGCIAGAIPVEEYRHGLAEAGFAHVELVDSGADLNAYTLVDGQSARCPPSATVPGLVVVDARCCPPVGPAAVVDDAFTRGWPTS